MRQKCFKKVKKILATAFFLDECCRVMNSFRLAQLLLIGVFALVILASSAQAQRPPRGGTVTPPPAPSSGISPR